MGKQKKLSRKEKTEKLISKCAFGILMALCVQFLIYLLILNFVPSFVEDANGNATYNPLYYLEADYYGSSQVDNGTRIIYYYNMVLLLATVILVLYYFVNFMENNDGRMGQKIKKFLKEQWPLTILLVFMIWVFISSLLAKDYYRSFIGCFNLKDGYLSFMMYASMLICSLLLGKDNEKYRKIIVNTFLVTATILAILTLWNYYFLTSEKYTGDDKYITEDGRLYVGGSTITNPLRYYYDVIKGKDGKYYYIVQNSEDGKYYYAMRSGDGKYYYVTEGEDGNYYYEKNASEDEPVLRVDQEADIEGTVVTIGELLFGNGGYPLGENFLIVTKRIGSEYISGIFHNSNHYGYYLSICVIVAATMFMKEKKILLSLVYMISYIIMLKMAIINNTFGAYLGIVVSIIFMLIYAFIPKKEKDLKHKKECICAGVIAIILIILSITTVNTSNVNVVYNNFSILAEDMKTLIANSNDESLEENLAEAEINMDSGSQDESGSNTVLSSGSNSLESGSTSGNKSESGSDTSGEENKKEENQKDVAEIGSGRGKLWKNALIMALQRPFFGYGLENIKYEYDEQFDINEGRSHNLVLQLAATTGIVGMLLYVCGIASIWIRKLRYISEWNIYECIGMFVIVSYIVSSLVGNSAFYTSGYFYIFVGFVALSPVIENKSQDKTKK